MRTLFLLVPFFLTACASGPSSGSSRFDAAPLSFTAQTAPMDAQTAALSELSHRIVVQTTLKGAGIGAVVGCGLVVVSAANAKNCVVAAAAGAAGGAVVGNKMGKRKVAQQVQTVSPSAVVRTLRKTNDQMALVQKSLPARLAEQEYALAQLDLQRASGTIDSKTHARDRNSIMAERGAIAAALLETEGHATQAATNMRAAQTAGQSGLEWHIAGASKLATQASSARSSISLL